MKRMSGITLAAMLAGFLLFTPGLPAQAPEPGFKSLFNGKDLTGWAGRTNHWSVQEGSITGITSSNNPAQGNNFLFAQEGSKPLVVDDFELRFSYKFTGEWGNSGVQYRSKDLGNFVAGGYQADFEVGTKFSGILYEEKGRGILCQRGLKVLIKENPAKADKPLIETVAKMGDSQEIQSHIQVNGWNEYVVIAKGNHLQHFINGIPTADVVDEQASKAAKEGILALQIHAGPPMKVQFKNIRIKSLK